MQVNIPPSLVLSNVSSDTTHSESTATQPPDVLNLITQILSLQLICLSSTVQPVSCMYFPTTLPVSCAGVKQEKTSRRMTSDFFIYLLPCVRDKSFVIPEKLSELIWRPQDLQRKEKHPIKFSYGPSKIIHSSVSCLCRVSFP